MDSCFQKSFSASHWFVHICTKNHGVSVICGLWVANKMGRALVFSLSLPFPPGARCRIQLLQFHSIAITNLAGDPPTPTRNPCVEQARTNDRWNGLSVTDRRRRLRTFKEEWLAVLKHLVYEGSAFWGWRVFGCSVWCKSATSLWGVMSKHKVKKKESAWLQASLDGHPNASLGRPNSSRQTSSNENYSNCKKSSFKTKQDTDNMKVHIKIILPEEIWLV